MGVDEIKLKCTNWHGQFLVSSVQITHELARKPSETCLLVAIEEQADSPQVAASLNGPRF